MFVMHGCRRTTRLLSYTTKPKSVEGTADSRPLDGYEVARRIEWPLWLTGMVMETDGWETRRVNEKVEISTPTRLVMIYSDIRHV